VGGTQQLASSSNCAHGSTKKGGYQSGSNMSGKHVKKHLIQAQCKRAATITQHPAHVGCNGHRTVYRQRWLPASTGLLSRHALLRPAGRKGTGTSGDLPSTTKLAP
jgi:hypothetical protein